jgi:radical SAM superfamily enzyme YgiQ (UPF0313 family)
MKIQLFAVESAHRSINHENIGLSRISAYLSKNEIQNEVTHLYYDGDMETEFNKIDLSFDLFGFSIFSLHTDFAITIINSIKMKKKDALIFLGGSYASFCADSLLDDCKNIDFIVLGNGEIPLINTINGLKNGINIENLFAKNEHIMSQNERKNKKLENSDINSLVWPKRDYLLNHNNLFAYISSSHSCSGKCSFCTTNVGKVTFRSADDIFDEIIYINKLTNLRCFVFTDGSFEDPGTLGKARIKNYATGLLSIPKNSHLDVSSGQKVLKIIMKILNC